MILIGINRFRRYLGVHDRGHSCASLTLHANVIKQGPKALSIDTNEPIPLTPIYCHQKDELTQAIELE